MTEKNNIQVNRKQFSSKEIEQKQNLGAILNHHKKLTKRPIYQQKKFYFTLFLILLIVFLLYLN